MRLLSIKMHTEHMVLSYFVIFSLFTQICKAEKENTTLRLVQIIFRHGKRTPIDSYPTDPYNNDSYWPDGWGQLTIDGKQQEYDLGAFLRKRYSEFLTGNPREVSVRSSGITRCLESAACNLASFYAPSGRWIWNKNLNWQPIPIETIPPDQDGMLNPASNCPEADKERERIINSPEGQQFLEEHKIMLDYAARHSGQEIPDWRKANWLFDTLKLEKANNLTLPSWTESIWNELEYVSNMSFYWDFKTKQIQRLRAGLVLQEISKNLQYKADGKLPETQRLFIYSSHDTLIAALLNSWDVFNMLAPPFSATILIELHERAPNNYTVRFLYKNETQPHVLVLPKCQEYCPLGHYLHFVRDLIPENWKAECGLEQSPPVFSSQAKVVVISVGSILVLFVVGFVILAWCLCRKVDDSIFYQLVPTN